MAFLPLLTAATAVIGLGATVAGGVASAAGASQQASANAQMYNYQAGIAQQNQQIAEQNKSYALIQGEANAAQSGMASRFRMGSIITGQAASGFDVNSGSNKQVQESASQVANTEQTIIRSNSAKAAYDYEIGAVQAGEQASAYSASAVNAKTAGDIAVTSSILGTAGSVSDKWLQGQQSGVFSSWGS